MSAEMELRFYKLYEQLASLTQNVNRKPDIPQIESVLHEVAVMFRLAKGVTHFYRNPGEEMRGEGETMISYDTGEPCHPVHTVRFVTRLMAITTMTVYMTDEAEPLSEDELFKVDLAMRTVLAYISRNRLQDIAEELAFYDDMGFRNIRSFFNFIEWKGKPGGLYGKAVVNYNFRHFALVNEEHGREGGDNVLFRHFHHVEKIIGSEGIAARLGGDIFVCICGQDTLPTLINYLNDAEVPVDESGTIVHISAAAGVLLLDDPDIAYKPNDIMGKVLHACRVAQEGLQGDTVYYSDELMTERERKRRIQKQFPEALRNGEFRVFFQPKVRTETGEICGAEALCRWFRDGGIVPPIQFIPVLEETSAICELDFEMLRQACVCIRKWLDEGRRPVRVSVNISRRHITNPDTLMKTILSIIDSHNVPHEYIEIELTETTTDVEFKDLRRIVDGLHQQNIWTSVDDFGMGYSSLNLIRAVPWNVLKVDRSFLPDDSESKESTSYVMFKYVVAMAKALGLECITEGVETPAQFALLRENKCDLAQGYLFDKPLPVEEFEKRLDQRRYDIPTANQVI